jgi:hypothetical protein
MHLIKSNRPYRCCMLLPDCNAPACSESIIIVIIINGSTLWLGPGQFFSFVILCTVNRTPWKWDQPVARPLPAHRTAQTRNKRTQTSKPRVGFESMTTASERAKTVHVLDSSAIVIGVCTNFQPHDVHCRQFLQGGPLSGLQISEYTRKLVRTYVCMYVCMYACNIA